MYLFKNRSVISLSGEDKENFLQGIITKDIKKLNDNMLYSLILTPQGKLLFDIYIFKSNDTIFIDVQSEVTDSLIKKLLMYKLRSKIEIKAEPDFRIFATKSKVNNSICLNDHRLNEIGFRVYDNKGLIIENDNLNYDKKRIDLTLPEYGKELIPEKTFPLELGLDYLNAIDFDKGCYVGQEVTARTKYRGVIRKALYKIEAEFDLNVQDIIYDESNNEIGVITSAYKNIGIAVLKNDEVENKNIFISGKNVNFKKALWYENKNI